MHIIKSNALSVSIRQFTIASLLFTGLTSVTIATAAPTIEKRSLSKPENTTTTDVKNPQTSTEWQLYQRILVLDEEVTQLRDQVERMQAMLDSSVKKQKRRNQTLDKRLQNQENVLIEVVDKLEQDDKNTLSAAKNNSSTTKKDAKTGVKIAVKKPPVIKTSIKPTPKTKTIEDDFRKPTNEQMAKKSYLAAYNIFKKQGKNAGVISMRKFINTYPRSRLIPSAHFWIGEFHLSGSEPDLNPAKSSFTTVLKRFPKSQKIPKTLYRLGYIAHLQNNNKLARNYMNRVLNNHAQTREAGLAKVFLKRLK